MSTMSNGAVGGNFATLVDLQASKPLLNTKVVLIGVQEYKVETVSVNGLSLANGLFANPVFNAQNIRYSLIDNPLCHLFKTNKLVEASAPTSTTVDASWLRSTDGTDDDRYGLLRTAGINVPRENEKGFFFEHSSTNFSLWSDDQTQAATWTDPFTRWTVAGDNLISPDGTLNADTITLTDASPLIRVVIPSLAAGVYTISFWAKIMSGTLTSGLIDIGDEGAGVMTPDLNTISSEWQRFTRTITTTVAHTAWDIELVNSIGATISIFRGQVEVGTLGTSGILTTIAAASRGADIVDLVAYNNVSKFDEPYTFIFNLNSIPSISTSYIYTMDSAFTFSCSYDATNLNIVNGGVVISHPVNLNANIAITYDGTTMILYYDAVKVASATGTPSTTLPNIFRAGSSEIGVSQLNGYLNNFRGYNSTLNIDEIGFLS